MANLLQNAYQKVLFLKNVFHIDYAVFLAKKNQRTLNVGKIRHYDEERVFFRKKNVFTFYKNGKAQNMPVVADRLVYSLIEMFVATTVSRSLE